MASDTSPNTGSGNSSLVKAVHCRKRPPAIHVGADVKPFIEELESNGGKAQIYASPSRTVLDAIGAPRAIQRVFASARGDLVPPRAHTTDDDDRQIRSVTDIGNRVKEARNAMGMTQQRFADLAGVGRRFLIELEHGKPGLEIGRVLVVCKAAGIKLGILS